MRETLMRLTKSNMMLLYSCKLTKVMSVTQIFRNFQKFKIPSDRNFSVKVMEPIK